MGISVRDPRNVEVALRDLADGYKSTFLWVTDFLGWATSFGSKLNKSTTGNSHYRRDRTASTPEVAETCDFRSPRSVASSPIFRGYAFTAGRKEFSAVPE